LNIAIVCPNFPPASFEGGISHYSAHLADHFLRRKHKVYAIASSEFAPEVFQLENKNKVEIIRITGPWNYLSIGKIKKVVKEKKIESIILQYAPAVYKTSFRIRWAITRFPCKKLTTFHTLWGNTLDRILGLLLLFGSSKIVATNSEIISIFRRRIPFFLKKTYRIPIATNVLPIKVEDNQKKELYPIVSYFGMLYPGKGLDLILDTLEELKRKNEQFIFKFIGGKIIYYQSYENYFKDELERRNLKDVADHLGYVPPEDVSEWLTRSRFVFLPYEQGLSDRRGTFMAAIAHGKAVLTSPPIVPMSILKNGINVIWPSEINLDAYVEMAQKLLHDDELISKLEKGAKGLSCLFSWEKIAEKYEIALS
jgi:glycosyltransferase involved in cell wall biosynthesis